MSDQPEFPLLKLPIICIEEVLHQIPFIELIDVSLTSKRMYHIIRSLRIPQLVLRVLARNQVIILFFTVKKKEYGNWIFPEQGSRFWKRWDAGVKLETEKRTIGGVEMYFRPTEVDTQMFLGTYTTGDIGQASKIGIEYAQNLFRRPINRITYGWLNMPVNRQPHRLGVTRCEELFIDGNAPMNNADLLEILKSVDVTERLHLKLPIRDTINLDPNQICAKEVRFFQRGWINKERLFSLTCNRICLRSVKPILTSDDVNAFVHRWFHSEDTNFEFLFAKVAKYKKPLNWDEYQPMEWCPKRRGEYFQTDCDRAVSLSFGHDIQRKDGLLATVFNTKVFIFCVWHDRFPSVDGLLRISLLPAKEEN